MIKSLLNSHRKKIRPLLYALVVFCVFLALANISLSALLNNALKQVSRLTQESVPGLSLNVRFAYFNLLRGVTFYGIECRRDGELIISGRKADIGFDVLSLKDRKVRIKNIRFDRTRVNAARVSDLSVLLDKALWKMDMPVEFFETTYFTGSDVSLSDTVLADVKGYVSWIKGNTFISRGDLTLKKISVPAFPDADIFRGSPFYKPFDYVFESRLDDGDFSISRFEISNPILKFTGSGRIREALIRPEVALNVDFLNIVFDNFPMLNQENVRTRGVLDARLKVSGPVEGLKAVLDIKIANAEANFFDTLLLTKINGSAQVTGDLITGKDFSLFINAMPFAADFTIVPADYPHILLKISSLNQVAKLPAFVLEIDADSLEKELFGKARTMIRYLSSESVNTLDFELQDFRLGYRDGLYVNVENLNAGLTVEPIAPSKKEKIKSSIISLKHPFCVLRRDEEGFSLGNIRGKCYGGGVEGQINFTTRNDKPGITGEAHLREVDLGDFFESYQGQSYALLGKLDGDLRFDTHSADMFKGQLFITDGVIEKNPLLNAVSDFLGVPSLKKVSFDELSIFFSGGRGEYSSQVKLDSPLVKGSLDGKISAYDKMDGYLQISLATQLMNESKQFKKILTYIRHDEPFVVFPFKISAYINSPRVLWLKNEFKDKLSNLLPERNKRFLQGQVNSMVEKMEVE
ncbi:MAG TPA: hypothetical protein DCL35_04500 [Candidatus Omnitrophica bacterium]|nr:hypothetical protein [Candidatus Omnitrophota bacterium]